MITIILMFKVNYSPINEQLTALNSTKSLDINLSLKSTRDTLSPVIDTQRMSVFAIGNRINKVTSSGAYTVSTNASPSTDPEGDDNATIYCTKQILLENPVSAIKMFFSGNVGVDSDVVGMFKILRVDDVSVTLMILGGNISILLVFQTQLLKLLYQKQISNSSCILLE